MSASNMKFTFLLVIPTQRASSASCAPAQDGTRTRTRGSLPRRSRSRSRPLHAGPTCLPRRRPQAGAADRPVWGCTPAGMALPDTLPGEAARTGPQDYAQGLPRIAFTRPSVLPSAFATASAPGITIFARLNGWPLRSPTDASPPSLRTTEHGSGPMWLATPSPYRTCTDYSLPVSRRTAKDCGHYLARRWRRRQLPVTSCTARNCRTILILWRSSRIDCRAIYGNALSAAMSSRPASAAMLNGRSRQPWYDRQTGLAGPSSL